MLPPTCRCAAGECLEAVSGELDFFCLPNCFELFGFDLLVDDDWHVWLLEVHMAAQHVIIINFGVVTIAMTDGKGQSLCELLMPCSGSCRVRPWRTSAVNWK